jgi:hypothetical protein
MNTGRVGEERGGMETDGCPLTGGSSSFDSRSGDGRGTNDCSRS